MRAPTDDDGRRPSRHDAAASAPGGRSSGTRPPPSPAPSWTVVREERRTAVVRRDFVPRFGALGLIRAADVPPAGLAPAARSFRPRGGRGELARVPAGPLGEAVVRPFRRGGLAARVATHRYLLGDRAFRELGVTERLRRAGVPTVEPLAAVQSPRRPGYRAALITRFLAEATPAPEALARGDGGGGDRERASAGRPPLRDALRRMGNAARMLHDAGGHHPDLNAHNFLLPSDRTRPAVLLDFDRARRLPFALPRPAARWSVRRLRRSVAKLGLSSALDAWDAFETGYSEGADARP